MFWLLLAVGGGPRTSVGVTECYYTTHATTNASTTCWDRSTPPPQFFLFFCLFWFVWFYSCNRVASTCATSTSTSVLVFSAARNGRIRLCSKYYYHYDYYYYCCLRTTAGTSFTLLACVVVVVVVVVLLLLVLLLSIEQRYIYVAVLLQQQQLPLQLFCSAMHWRARSCYNTLLTVASSKQTHNPHPPVSKCSPPAKLVILELVLVLVLVLLLVLVELY